jgi:ribosomal protein S18 acetylase RimI-like enzyme
MKLLNGISICMKQYINEEDYKVIDRLKNICEKKEEMYLKLELDFKLGISETANKDNNSDFVNEFLYYKEEELIGYLGIFSFGGEEAELTGMVHPEFRRKGIFKRLYDLAASECKRRNFKRILLVCDNKSASGLEFIKAVGAAYSFSEYEMKFLGSYSHPDSQNITLRKALNSDAEEIARQNGVYFGVTSDILTMPEEEEKRQRITFMIELEGKVIGKIKVNTDEGYIGAFGILPEYRRKGYGREALNAALKILKDNNINKASLAVAASNKNALNLYKSCGFVEESVMDYFEA